jgi:hypothetical protein
MTIRKIKADLQTENPFAFAHVFDYDSSAIMRRPERIRSHEKAPTAS